MKATLDIQVNKTETQYDVLQNFKFIFKLDREGQLEDKVFTLNFPSNIKVNVQHPALQDIFRLIGNSYLHKLSYFGYEVSYLPFNNKVFESFQKECFYQEELTLGFFPFGFSEIQTILFEKVAARLKNTIYASVEPLNSYTTLKKDDLSILSLGNGIESALLDTIFKKFKFNHVPCSVVTDAVEKPYIKNRKDVSMIVTDLGSFCKDKDLFPEEYAPLQNIFFNDKIPHFLALEAIVAVCSNAKNVIVGDEKGFSTTFYNYTVNTGIYADYTRSTTYRNHLSSVLKSCSIDVQIVSIFENLNKISLLWLLYDFNFNKEIFKKIQSCTQPIKETFDGGIIKWLPCGMCQKCRVLPILCMALGIEAALFPEAILKNTVTDLALLEDSTSFYGHFGDKEELRLIKGLSHFSHRAYLRVSLDTRRVMRLQEDNPVLLTELKDAFNISLQKFNNIFDTVRKNNSLEYVKFGTVTKENNQLKLVYEIKPKFAEKKLVTVRINMPSHWEFYLENKNELEIIKVAAAIFMVPFKLNADYVEYPNFSNIFSRLFIESAEYMANTRYEFEQSSGSNEFGDTLFFKEPNWAAFLCGDYKLKEEDTVCISSDSAYDNLSKYILEQSGYKVDYTNNISFDYSELLEHMYKPFNFDTPENIRGIDMIFRAAMEIVEVLYFSFKGNTVVIREGSIDETMFVRLKSSKRYTPKWWSSNIWRRAVTKLFIENGFNVKVASLLEGFYNTAIVRMLYNVKLEKFEGLPTSCDLIMVALGHAGMEKFSAIRKKSITEIMGTIEEIANTEYRQLYEMCLNPKKELSFPDIFKHHELNGFFEVTDKVKTVIDTLNRENT